MTEITEIDAATEAADQGNWPAATAGAERVIDRLVRGIASQDTALVAAIGDAAAEASLGVALEHDIPAPPTPATVVTLFRAIAAVAAVARRGSARVDDTDTRGLIIERLMLAGSRPLTNTELARACSRSEETIARVLRPLRNQGFVLTRPAGRSKQNWITEAGRRHYEGDNCLHRCFVQLEKRDEPASDALSWRDVVLVEQWQSQNLEATRASDLLLIPADAP